MVAYRAMYVNGAATQELPRPVHVRDVAKILDLYFQKNRPIVMCEGRPVTMDGVQAGREAVAARPTKPASLEIEPSLGSLMEQ